jgi:NAD(P)-dependent dehydrogenase (short-subunit alcohol dehydrogenase family)
MTETGDGSASGSARDEESGGEIGETDPRAAKGPNRPPALVTGGAVRLGRAFALHLARRGHDVALHYHSSADAAEETARMVREAGRRCQTFRADLGELDGLDAFFREVQTAFPGLGVLVNNASVYFERTMATTTPEELRRCLHVNTAAPWLLTAAFARGVQEARTGPPGGIVVNIIDNKIHFNQTDYAPYLLSKHGLSEVTRLSALEFAPDIRVNGIAPGVVMPASSRAPDYVAWRIEGIPVKKQGDSRHLTEALDYLLDNDFVTGQILTVDGGEGLMREGRHFGNYPESL